MGFNTGDLKGKVLKLWLHHLSTFDHNYVRVLTKPCTQLNTGFRTDDNIKQFKLHFTDTNK